MGGFDADEPGTRGARRHLVHDPEQASREFNASRRQELNEFYSGATAVATTSSGLRARGDADATVTGLQVGGRRPRGREPKKWHPTDEEFMDSKRREYSDFVRQREVAMPHSRAPSQQQQVARERSDARIEATCGLSLPDIGERTEVNVRRDELNAQRRADMRAHLEDDRIRGHYRLRNRPNDTVLQDEPQRSPERQRQRLSGRKRQQLTAPPGISGAAAQAIASEPQYFEETPLLSVDRFAAAKEAEVERRRVEQQRYFRGIMEEKHGGAAARRQTKEEYQAKVANVAAAHASPGATGRVPIWLGGATVADDDRRRRDAKYAVELDTQLRSREQNRANAMLQSKISDESVVKEQVENYPYGRRGKSAGLTHGRVNLTQKEQKQWGKGGVVDAVFGGNGAAFGGGRDVGAGTPASERAAVTPANEAQNTMRSLASSIEYLKGRYDKLQQLTDERGDAYDPYAPENRSKHGVRNTLVQPATLG